MIAAPAHGFVDIDSSNANPFFNNGYGTGRITPYNPNGISPIPGEGFKTWNIFFVGDGDDTSATIDATVTLKSIQHSYDWTATSKPAQLGSRMTRLSRLISTIRFMETAR